MDAILIFGFCWRICISLSISFSFATGIVVILLKIFIPVIEVDISNINFLPAG
jgi:hypothetical protein